MQQSSAYETMNHGTQSYSVSKVIKLSFSALVRNKILSLFVISLFFIPALIVFAQIYLFNDGGDKPIPLVLIFCAILYFIIAAVAQGALAYGAYNSLKNQTAPVGQCLRVGFKRVGSVLVVSFLANLGIGLGNMLLYIPGIILACMWAVVVPTCVVEKTSIIGSFKRSYFLTKGYCWNIFGTILLSGVLWAILIILFSFLSSSFRGEDSSLGVVLSFLMMGLLVSMLLFFQYMYIVIYYELRSIKEGASIDKLINVFE